MRAHPSGHRCPVCALALVVGQGCPDCAALAPAFDRVVTAFDSVPPVDQLILQLKTASQFTHAPFMAAELAFSARFGALDGVGFYILGAVTFTRIAFGVRGL